MNKKENLLRAIRRQSPQYVPYRYDGSLTLLRPRVNPRPPQGGVDDWGVRWLSSNTEEGSYPQGDPVLDVNEVESFERLAQDINWQTVHFHVHL